MELRQRDGVVGAHKCDALINTEKCDERVGEGFEVDGCIFTRFKGVLRGVYGKLKDKNSKF